MRLYQRILPHRSKHNRSSASIRPIKSNSIIDDIAYILTSIRYPVPYPSIMLRLDVDGLPYPLRFLLLRSSYKSLNIQTFRR